MKNFILVIILICCFLIGFYIKNYYSLRKNTYEKLYNFVQKLLNSISYNNEKLTIFVVKEVEEEKGLFKKFLENYGLYLNSKINKFDFNTSIKKTFYFLTTNETDKISNFVTLIGSKTKDEEVEQLNNYLYVLKQKNNLEIENYNKFANLYFKLFIILGIALFIVFI